MQEAKHLGKIVLRVPSPVGGFPGTGSFLVTGGLTGLGLAVARWLVQRGVRHLALMGRRPADATAQATLAELRAAGGALLVLQGDVTQEFDVRTVLTEGMATLPRPPGGFHCAAVLYHGARGNRTG